MSRYCWVGIAELAEVVVNLLFLRAKYLTEKVDRC